MTSTVMIVEDEPSLITMLRYNLERHGFAVTEATTGEQALALLGVAAPDAILLDWILPQMSGVDVCRELRRLPKTRHVPVIMLTARGTEGDRIQGFNVGADDYVTKPFSIAELMARLKALLRRSRPVAPRDSLAYGDITLDLDARRAIRAGRPIHLGPTELRLLTHFMENPARAFTRDELLKAVWGPNIHVEPRTVDVHIRLLRRALNGGGARDPIRTVRSVGYALDVD
jgi:two-component system phosphate regulon response regulator PhoB